MRTMLLLVSLCLLVRSPQGQSPRRAVSQTAVPTAVEKQPESPQGIEAGRRENDYARGFSEGLEEHRAMLAEIRQELEATQKTNNAMTWIYGLFAAFLFSTGAFSLYNVRQSRSNVEEAKREVEEFVALKEAIVSELHSYLREMDIPEGTLNPNLITPMQRAAIDEHDHLTFLANPLFRFRDPATADKLELNCQVLLKSARWHLSEARHAEGLSRLTRFFQLRELFAAQQNDKMMARAHSYRAYAHIGLLKYEEQERVIKTAESKFRVVEYRKRIEEDLRAAKRLDPDWALTYIWEGIYVSLHPLIPEGTSAAEESRLRRNAQLVAIQIYRQFLTSADTKHPDVACIAQDNLCCCLKRLGDFGADYEPMFSELETMLSESALQQRHGDQITVENGQQLCSWKRILVDGVFFASVNGDTAAYAGRWKDILERKVDVTHWREFCRRMVSRSAQMGAWQVKVWE